MVEEYTSGRFSVVCTCGFRGPEMKSSSEACRVVELLIEVRDLLKVEDKT
jgi:hypothetical protein